MTQLLLLQEQTAGHTLALAVAASGGEEARQQHHQVPQRDLHRSARTRQARATEVPSRWDSPRCGPQRRRHGETSLNLRGTYGERADRMTPTLHQFHFIGSVSGIWVVGQRVGGSEEGSAGTRKWPAWVGWRERAVNEKTGIFQWAESGSYRPEETDR